MLIHCVVTCYCECDHAQRSRRSGPNLAEDAPPNGHRLRDQHSEGDQGARAQTLHRLRPHLQVRTVAARRLRLSVTSLPWLSSAAVMVSVLVSGRYL